MKTTSKRAFEKATWLVSVAYGRRVTPDGWRSRGCGAQKKEESRKQLSLPSGCIYIPDYGMYGVRGQTPHCIFWVNHDTSISVEGAEGD